MTKLSALLQSQMSGTFEIGIESKDSWADTKIIAKTSNKICGGLKAVNLANIQDR